ncbi:MAG: PAS domain S-box-containing protein [Roseivirga sp.]|jgi:PAS domain S-box-containing protein
MDVKKLTELSIDIVCTIDHEGNIGYVNPAFSRALGYLKEKLEDKSLFDFIHPDDVEETVAHVRSLVVNKDCIKFENRILCKDQSIKYFSWNVCSIKDENIIYAIGNDITERKSILANLSQSSHVLGLSQSIAKVGGWELDLITNELFWTAETYRIHDANAESFDPSADAGLDYYLPESRARLSEALQMARENGEAYDLELQLKTALGRIIDVRTTCKVTVKEGQSIKLTGAFQDITDRKNAEKKLNKAKKKAKESKKYLFGIINHIGVPLFVKDNQSRLTLVNDAFCTLFQLSKNDVLGKTLAEKVSPEEREHFLKIDKEVLKTGQENIVEESMTLNGNGTRIISTRKERFVDNEGNKFLVGTIRDITENIKAQEEIKNSEESFSNAFENAPYPIAILNINTGDRIAVNNTFSETFGYTKSELLEGNIYVKNLCQNQNDFLNGITILKKEGSLKQFPLVMNPKSDKIKMMLVNATRFLTDNNDVFITSFMDITELKEREKTLEQSDRVFNAAIDMFCIAGFDGYFQYLNPEWERTLGWTTEELTSKPWIEFVHPEEKGMTENIKSLIIKGQEIYRFENRYICKDGSIKWLSWNLNPYVGEGIFIGVARDITESKEVEVQLINAKKRAEEAHRLKSSFLSNMSHEIRTPMNGVIGFSELLKSDNLSSEERKRYLDVIDRNSKQLLDLIDDIIDISKMESDQLKITIKECQVSQIISDLLIIFNEIKSVHSKPNIEFRANLPDKFKDLVILTDGLRIRQVLTNLLTNALKYSEKGIISFGVDVINDEVVFYVKDEGIGISEENIGPIFERFKQLESTDNEGVGAAGAGLGLAICKGIVELLGGTISVKSELNVGSEFTFRIPFNKGKIRKTDQAKRKETSISLEGKTILIAEDGATARLYFKVALEETKANILFANNGKVAIELFMAHPEIDVVMMDIGMPIMNGFQAMEQILKLDPSAKIIAQTAYAMTNEKEKCFAIGCKDYLTKPIQKEALIQVLGRWVE